MRVPHIGETVLVHDKDCFSNGAVTVPAIVQQVFNAHPVQPGVPVLVNLIAFPYGMTPKTLGSVTWHPDTPLIPSDDFRGAWPKHEGHVAHVGDIE